MDAFAAAYALVFIDDADTVFIIVDRIDRADLLAGSDQMGDGPVRTGIRTHSAFLTFVHIDPGTVTVDIDRIEPAGIETGLAQTQTAVVGNGIGSDRTLFTGRFDDLDDVVGITFDIRILIPGKPDTPSQDLSFLVYAAAQDACGPGDI